MSNNGPDFGVPAFICKLFYKVYSTGVCTTNTYICIFYDGNDAEIEARIIGKITQSALDAANFTEIGVDGYFVWLIGKYALEGIVIDVRHTRADKTKSVSANHFRQLVNSATSTVEHELQRLEKRFTAVERFLYCCSGGLYKPNSKEEIPQVDSPLKSLAAGMSKQEERLRNFEWNTDVAFSRIARILKPQTVFKVLEDDFRDTREWEEYFQSVLKATKVDEIGIDEHFFWLMKKYAGKEIVRDLIYIRACEGQPALYFWKLVCSATKNMEYELERSAKRFRALERFLDCCSRENRSLASEERMSQVSEATAGSRFKSLLSQMSKQAETLQNLEKNAESVLQRLAATAGSTTATY
jgi:hypothetical protein